MSALRLDVIVKDYDEGDRWTWRLWAGSRIVASSGSQRYSRRIGCLRGAEIGAGLHDLVNSRGTFSWRPHYLNGAPIEVDVRLYDARRVLP